MEAAEYDLKPVMRGDVWRGINPLRLSTRSETAESWVADLDTDTLTSADHGKSDGDRYAVIERAAGLLTGKVYHVVNATDDTIQLSEEADGEVVGLTFSETVSLYAVTAPGLPVASARMQFRVGSEDGSLQFELTTASGGGLALVSAEQWDFIVPPRQAGFVRQGTHHYDLEVTDSGGNVITPIKGTIEVLPDVSKT